MNSYELSRNWFDWSFENPEKVSPIHSAIFFMAIEHCNRLGWKRKFGFPSQMVMEAIGVKSYNTYINAFKELVDWGFIELIEKSKNQYSANIIALSNIDEAHNKALDKALIKHGRKQRESTGESIDSINKQYNNITKNKEQESALGFLEINFPSRFNEFLMQNKKQLKDFEKFSLDFNDTVEQEKLEFDSALFGRLGKYTRNWINNQNRYSPVEEKEKQPSYLKVKL